MAKVGEISEHERLRRRAGLTVTEFARVVGFSHAYVSQIETGRLRPSSRYRSAAAIALGVPEAVLWPGAES